DPHAFLSLFYRSLTPVVGALPADLYTAIISMIRAGEMLDARNAHHIRLVPAYQRRQHLAG
ncbi:MAG: hypothetical protein VW462_11145, partial [Rhodospirillales bacterium]